MFNPRARDEERPTRSWQQRALLKDAVWGTIDGSIASHLRRVIDEATDERPVQRFLAEHRSVLAAALLRGHTRVVRPHVRLGAEYVPDFVIGDASSFGVRWTLVELESPTARMFTADGHYARKTREAVRQIESWRAWLADNKGYASRLQPNGLGLLGISANAQGLALIGRRHESDLEPDTEWMRRSTAERQTIDVHTYDWLLDLVDACVLGHAPSTVTP